MTGVETDRLGSAAVVGAGAWGTTLAILLAERVPSVTLWVYEPDLAEAMVRSRENALYLPGAKLPANVLPTSSLEAAVGGQPLVVFVPPSHAARRVFEWSRPALEGNALLVSATKGIEVETLCTMSQVMQEVLPPVHHPRLAAVSGPSFAKEVAAGLPTAIVAAARDAEVARAVQHRLSGGALRVYASTDLLGVELGGAVKNVIAIAAGVVDGLGLGTNARAAVITRGLAEITRLGIALGAQPATFAGLAGMGDLVLTCTGDLSRNRTLGKRLAEGIPVEEILAATRAVAEGVNTCRSVVRLAERLGVEMPICQATHRVLFEGQSSREAVVRLMTRDLRFEGE
jgi:glycerol-3-phosphate dehydrogenase (NAD(P)+)